ncbi:MAG: cupin [Alphaproteobacteria bacterium]|nr:cupin [Alphaproteobacteria bacterium]
MSSLTIYSNSDPDTVLEHTQQAEKIAEELRKIGVSFERWQPTVSLSRTADDQAVLSAYADDIERVSKAEGYTSVDVIRVFPDNPKCEELRAKFLAEHTHADDEARFFVEGAGMFYVHADEKIFMILCEAGDFIRVPQNATHWFDMGAVPHITAIRWFTRPDGWVAQFTGSDLSMRFPKYVPAQKVA